MHTAAVESVTVAMPLLAATEPVDSIHPYNIPILPFKHPPAKENFKNIRRQRKEHQSDSGSADSNASHDDGHVDDYA